METPVNRAYDLIDNRRHALALRSRTHCGMARARVRSTTLAFDAEDFFACRACVAVLEGETRWRRGAQT
jgi:hypothetical protein